MSFEGAVAVSRCSIQSVFDAGCSIFLLKNLLWYRTYDYYVYVISIQKQNLFLKHFTYDMYIKHVCNKKFDIYWYIIVFCFFLKNVSIQITYDITELYVYVEKYIIHETDNYKVFNLKKKFWIWIVISWDLLKLLKFN